MSDNVTNELMFEQFRAIRAELADLKAGQRRIESRLGSIDSLVVSFMQTDNRQEGDLVEVRDRLDRIERRLEIAD